MDDLGPKFQCYWRIYWQADPNGKLTWYMEMEKVLASYIEYSESWLKFVRRRASLDVYVDYLDALLDLGVLGDGSFYRLVFAECYLVANKKSPTQTGLNNFAVQDDKSLEFFLSSLAHWGYLCLSAPCHIHTWNISFTSGRNCWRCLRWKRWIFISLLFSSVICPRMTPYMVGVDTMVFVIIFLWPQRAMIWKIPLQLFTLQAFRSKDGCDQWEKTKTWPSGFAIQETRRDLTMPLKRKESFLM